MDIVNKINDLNKVIKRFLDELSQKPAIEDNDVLVLEDFATKISKLVFGNDMAGELTNDSYNLISWTDHLDEKVILNNFKASLSNRPLEKPSFLE